MGLRFFKEPKLEKPDLVACWPGIGNIGLLAVDTLRSQIGAEELGEVEAWDFFYPNKVIIRSGVLEDLEFPSNRFYYKRMAARDLLFFIGEEQPTDGGRTYAEGKKACALGNLILDMAEKFDCRRVYTSGAAVALTHHQLKPRVWAVAGSQTTLDEVHKQENTIVMSDIEGRAGGGNITGLNGLLLGLAKRRGFDAVCLMGEVPDYLSAAPFPYPKASRSVLEVLSSLLGVEIDFSSLDAMTAQIDTIITRIYSELPERIREGIEQRKVEVAPRAGSITEEEEKWIKEHIDELFKGGKGNERPS